MTKPTITTTHDQSTDLVRHKIESPSAWRLMVHHLMDYCDQCAFEDRIRERLADGEYAEVKTEEDFMRLVNEVQA